MQDRAADDRVREILSRFPLEGRIADVRPHGSGHINDTLAVTLDGAGAPTRFILQRINDSVFRDVPGLMENVGRVTAHLGSTVAREDSRRALTLVPTREGAPFHRSPDGGFWRVYRFIEGARSYDHLTSRRQAFEVARAFGAFQRALTSLPGGPLRETIPGFHDTRRRLEALRRAGAEDVAGRAREVAAELEFALRREACADRLSALVASGDLPVRVTHNDTKINNVLLDDATGEGICVIDLDTVMPGLSLYDFGDMVRSAANAAAEDERDLSRVGVRMPVFEALVRGYASGAGEMLNQAEWELLAFSAELLAYELGLRFLADYLQGDAYFRTTRAGQNLDRCRVQFRLCESFEENRVAMAESVREARRAT